MSSDRPEISLDDVRRLRAELMELYKPDKLLDAILVEWGFSEEAAAYLLHSDDVSFWTGILFGFQLHRQFGNQTTTTEE